MHVFEREIGKTRVSRAQRRHRKDTEKRKARRQAFERRTNSANQTHLSPSPRALAMQDKGSDREMLSASRDANLNAKAAKLAVSVAASGLSVPPQISFEKHGEKVGEFNLRISERM